MDLHFLLFKLLVVITALFFVSIQIKQLITTAYTVFAARSFGLKCDSVSLFGLLLTKHDGKWEYVKGKPSVLCNANIQLDLENRLTAEEYDRKEKIFSILQRTLLILVSAGLIFLFRGIMIKGLTLKGNLLEIFAAYTAFGLCFHSLASVGIHIYTYKVAMKRLGGYYQEKIKRIRNGEKFTSLDMKPIDQLEFKNPSKAERGMYNTLYATYLLACGRIEEMSVVAHDLTNQFIDSEYILLETGAYYFLIYYYSRFELIPHLAKHFLDKCIATISADKDSNGKRVLAYYAFGVEQDFPKARKYLNEAFSSIERFSVGDERDLERKLLWELDGFLKEKGY